MRRHLSEMVGRHWMAREDARGTSDPERPGADGTAQAAFKLSSSLCRRRKALCLQPLHVSGTCGTRQFILFLQNKIWSCSSVANSSGNAMERGPSAELLGHSWCFCPLRVAAWVCSPSQELAVPSHLNSRNGLTFLL